MTVRKTAAVGAGIQKRNAGPVEFESPFLLCVEGSDDQEVISRIIIDSGLDGFHVHSMGTNGGWKEKLDAIMVDDGFVRNCRVLALVQDADNDPDSAFQRCRNALEGNNLLPPDGAGVIAIGQPLHTAVFIVPGKSLLGAVEEMVLQASEPLRRKRATELLDRLAADGLSVPDANGRKRAELQVCLGTGAKVYKTLTSAALRREVFDWDSECFDEMRDFLRSVVKSIDAPDR